MLFRHFVRFALALARESAGSNMLARIAMMAITTSNSINVNPDLALTWETIEGFMPEILNKSFSTCNTISVGESPEHQATCIRLKEI
jgi:hypothetical protein